MINKNIMIILLENLPPFYEYLITTLKIMLMKELTMEYMTTCLIHAMSKRKE